MLSPYILLFIFFLSSTIETQDIFTNFNSNSSSTKLLLTLAALNSFWLWLQIRSLYLLCNTSPSCVLHMDKVHSLTLEYCLLQESLTQMPRGPYLILERVGATFFFCVCLELFQNKAMPDAVSHYSHNEGVLAVLPDADSVLKYIFFFFPPLSFLEVASCSNSCGGPHGR